MFFICSGSRELFTHAHETFSQWTINVSDGRKQCRLFLLTFLLHVIIDEWPIIIAAGELHDSEEKIMRDENLDAFELRVKCDWIARDTHSIPQAFHQ